MKGEDMRKHRGDHRRREDRAEGGVSKKEEQIRDEEIAGGEHREEKGEEWGGKEAEGSSKQREEVKGGSGR